MATIKKPFKIFSKAANTWNKYHLETDSTQVAHTKADGTDTTVAEQLLALNSTCIKTKQLSWTDVNATAGNPVLLKNFSIDSEWHGRTIVGIVPVSIRGYNTSSFVPSIYRQYSQSYFATTVSQSYDIVVNVLYI